jgi:hypothetical protein
LGLLVILNTVVGGHHLIATHFAAVWAKAAGSAHWYHLLAWLGALVARVGRDSIHLVLAVLVC